MPKPSPRNLDRRLLPLREGRPLLIMTGFLLTICITMLVIFQSRFTLQTELRIYDTMLDDRTSSPKKAVTVMVGIDDESLEEYGQWPWPRYRLASLVNQLKSLGAEVIALDILLPEPDRTSPEVIQADHGRGVVSRAEYSRSIKRDSYSLQLADSMAGANTILGCYFEFSGFGKVDRPAPPVLPTGMIVASTNPVELTWPRPIGAIRSLPVLTAAASSEGFTNAKHDLDGILRRVPLLMKYQDQFTPSLALGATLLASDNRNLRLINKGSEAVLLLGDSSIPLDRFGNMMIDFRGGKKSFPYLSAKQVLNGSLPEKSLAGKIVLVGAWATGLGDIHQTPGGRPLNGLEVNANIIDNILSGTFVSHPAWAKGAELFAVLLFGILSSWLFSRAGFIFSLVAVSVFVCGGYISARELLLTSGIFISPLLPMITPVIVMTILSLMKYGIESRKVLQRNDDLIEAQDAIIISMSALAEARDKETGRHLLRTQNYVEILARQLSKLPHYSHLDESSIDLLAKSAPLHDIGKVGIPDAILNKPGPLTQEELAIMKNHTLIGANAIKTAIRGVAHPENLDFLHYAQQMIASHHEKWDGSGYPNGLRGTDIPLAGRLMALADVYDALLCKRSYKKTYSHAEAMETILIESGRHFDPEVITAFVAKNEEFLRISQMFIDEYVPEIEAVTLYKSDVEILLNNVSTSDLPPAHSP